MKREKEVVVEVEQVLVFRKLEISGRGWCELCATDVVMIAPDLAAAISRQSTRTIYRWVEQGRLHYIDQSIGAGQVCLNSLQSVQDGYSEFGNSVVTNTH